MLNPSYTTLIIQSYALELLQELKNPNDNQNHVSILRVWSLALIEFGELLPGDHILIMINVLQGALMASSCKSNNDILQGNDLVNGTMG